MSEPAGDESVPAPKSEWNQDQALMIGGIMLVCFMIVFISCYTDRPRGCQGWRQWRICRCCARRRNAAPQDVEAAPAMPAAAPQDADGKPEPDNEIWIEMVPMVAPPPAYHPPAYQ